MKGGKDRPCRFFQIKFLAAQNLHFVAVLAVPLLYQAASFFPSNAPFVSPVAELPSFHIIQAVLERKRGDLRNLPAAAFGTAGREGGDGGLGGEGGMTDGRMGYNLLLLVS